jgi:hypothetical protein
MTALKNKNTPRTHGQCVLLPVGACLLTLALLEILLRFLPVQSHIPYEPVNELNQVARYRPFRSFVYSHHWNFQDKNCGRTNAQGFVSDFDYDAEDPRPLIAVVGDSYIEARMVSFSDTLQERLRAVSGSTARVYAFAMNGAALSQYLIFARHARDTFRPEALIVNIVSNDFDESFAAFQAIARFHYFAEDADGELRPRLIGFYYPSRWRELLSHSALVRYMYFHLRITDAPRSIRNFLQGLSPVNRSKKSRVRSADMQKKSDDRRLLSERAADVFLRLLPGYAGLAPESIVLILDGHRHSLYDATRGQDAGFEHLRRYVAQRARPMGYEVIDMHPVFERDFKTYGQRFDFTHDAHWNARAHALAAREAAMTGTIRRILSASQQPIH